MSVNFVHLNWRSRPKPVTVLYRTQGLKKSSGSPLESGELAARCPTSNRPCRVVNNRACGTPSFIKTKAKRRENVATYPGTADGSWDSGCIPARWDLRRRRPARTERAGAAGEPPGAFCFRAEGAVAVCQHFPADRRLKNRSFAIGTATPDLQRARSGGNRSERTSKNAFFIAAEKERNRKTITDQPSLACRPKGSLQSQSVASPLFCAVSGGVVSSAGIHFPHLLGDPPARRAKPNQKDE